MPLLYSLLVLALVSSTIATELGATCRPRAWVRAPDLAPGQVIQGDVRVKLDGPCDDISQYTLGLRFAERSWVKTRREGSTLPQRPTMVGSFSAWDSNDIYELDHLALMPVKYSGNESTWEQYEKTIKDPSLWLVREEERIGFETTFTLTHENKTSHKIVQPFAILVPFTNYPPAFDIRSTGSNAETDAADSEHIYSYFVNMTFNNGTQQQIQAGYTSFDVITLPPPPAVEVVETRTTRCWGSRKKNCNADITTDQDEFTLLIEFPQGRHFSQDTTNNFTIKSRQFGPGLQRPWEVNIRGSNAGRELIWASKFAVDNETAHTLLVSGIKHDYQLFSTPDDESRWERSNIWEYPEQPRFSPADAISNETGYTTEAVSTRVTINSNFYPSFDTYYHKSATELVLHFQVLNISSAATSGAGAIDEETYDWTPAVQEENVYHRIKTLFASIPIFVHRNRNSPTTPEAREPLHYLTPGARAPIFVDPSSVSELLQKSVESRDDLAPLAQATFVSQEDGEVVKYRYCPRCAMPGQSGPHYVGDTWVRKVLARSRAQTTPKSEPLLVQT